MGMDFIIGMIIGSLVMGGICGLLPFFIGKNYNQDKLGLAGLFACIGTGFLGGILLALPCAIIFTIIIILKK